jgi:hypothetical protein
VMSVDPDRSSLHFTMLLRFSLILHGGQFSLGEWSKHTGACCPSGMGSPTCFRFHWRQGERLLTTPNRLYLSSPHFSPLSHQSWPTPWIRAAGRNQTAAPCAWNAVTVISLSSKRGTSYPIVFHLGRSSDCNQLKKENRIINIGGKNILQLPLIGT